VLIIGFTNSVSKRLEKASLLNAFECREYGAKMYFSWPVSDRSPGQQGAITCPWARELKTNLRNVA
jgi:hypothetical protein